MKRRVPILPGSWFRLFSGAGTVHAVAQLFAGLERRYPARGDLDRLAGLWIPTRTRGRFPDRESTEPAEVDPLALRQALGHSIDERVNGCFHLRSGQPTLLRHEVHQISLLHESRILLWFLSGSIPNWDGSHFVAHR